MYGPISDPKEAAEAIADLLVVNFWTQGAFARTEAGVILDESRNPKAECFCALGLINAACDEPTGDILRRSLNEHLGTHDYISVWNDNPKRTREQVRAAFLAVAEKL